MIECLTRRAHGGIDFGWIRFTQAADYFLGRWVDDGQIFAAYSERHRLSVNKTRNVRIDRTWHGRMSSGHWVSQWWQWRNSA
jgi:hypothetical protein